MHGRFSRVGFDTRWRGAVFDEVCANRIGAALGELQVVIVAADAIGMSFYRYVQPR